MSQTSISVRLDAAIAAIDSLTPVKKQKTLECVQTYIKGLEKAVVGPFWPNGNIKDTIYGEDLDYIEGITLYFDEEKDLPSSGGGGGPSITVTDDPFTPNEDYKDMFILFEGETIIIPNDTTNDLPIDYEITIKQVTATQTLFVPEAGVAVDSIFNFLSIIEQFGVAGLRKTGANQWSLFGALG